MYMEFCEQKFAFDKYNVMRITVCSKLTVRPLSEHIHPVANKYKCTCVYVYISMGV